MTTRRFGVHEALGVKYWCGRVAHGRKKERDRRMLTRHSVKGAWKSLGCRGPESAQCGRGFSVRAGVSPSQPYIPVCASVCVRPCINHHRDTHARVTYYGERKQRTESSFLVGLCLLLKKRPQQVHRHITKAKISVIYRHESLYRLL